MFKLAKSIWSKAHKVGEMNDNLIFALSTNDLHGVKIKLACADFYRLSVNGIFIGSGPARTAKGFARVDEYDLSCFDNGEITVEVAGYNCGALSTVKQEPFFIAELVKNDEVIYYSGKDFVCYQNVQREKFADLLSVQRHFSETYDFTKENLRVQTKIVDYGIKYLSRVAPMPNCKAYKVDEYFSKGNFEENMCDLKNYYFLWSGKDWGFNEEEVKDIPFKYVLGAKQIVTDKNGALPASLSNKQWLMINFGKINAGFISLKGVAKEKTTLIIAMSEVVHGNEFMFCPDFGYQMHPVIKLTYNKGDKINFQSFEPYSFMYMAVFVVEGQLFVENVGYTTFERPTDNIIKRQFNNPDLQSVYNAAIRSFSHNSVDIFTDCPLRERAGWLCDSFFSARAEYFLYGNSDVEKDFLENFVLFNNEGDYPEGVLPMCYPSSYIGKFIPQWNLWFVLQVAEHLSIRNKNADKNFYKDSVLDVLNFFAKHENKDGLLQNLPSWNFIEWSEANSWGQDVNYPTNMLYSSALREAGKVFDIPKFIDKAERIKNIVIEKSFNGDLFVDNAVKNYNGELINTINVSEACQYYAILFLGLDLNDKKFAKLKEFVYDDFNALEKDKVSFFNGKQIYFCQKEAFIGLYLRMSVLLLLKDADLINKCVKEYFLDMSKKTQTLWEYRKDISSHNHGFVSYVSCILPFADK